MKKTGFTLVEILAVLVILGILAAITVPIVGNLLTGSKDDLYGVQMKNIENGAKGWATKNTSVLPAEEGDVITITLGQLKLSGDVVVDIKNPKTGVLFPNDMEIEIKRLHRNYVYDIKDETGEDTSPLNPDLLMPTLILNGSTTHYVEINAEVEYEDPGYTARKIDGSNLTDVTVEIKANNTVVSSVDTTRMGQYKITYTAIDQGKSISMIRTVIVRDTTPPVLTVPEETTVQLTELATFNYMIGVSATDNSLEVPTITRSGLVSSIPGTYTVIYEATDASNNKSTKSRRIIVQDNQGPNIAFSMNGNSTWAQSRSTSITVSDISGININSLKYLWATSSSGVTEGSFSTSLTNGATLSTPSSVTGDYYLWVLAKDNSGNTSIVRSGVFKLDNIIPIITRTGNASVTINVGSSYTDAGATVTDAHSGVTGGVTTTGTVNVNLPGTYTITYTKSDNAGNAATPVTRTVIVQDTVIPTVTFGTNGQGAWAKSRSTTVTANDNVAVNTSSLRYLWTTTASGIVEANFITSFTNGVTLSTPAGVTGDYYLWVLAKDTSGNTNIVRSNVFKLDNTLPTITHPGATTLHPEQVPSFGLLTGVTSSDAHSGISGAITTSGMLSVMPGSYTITYTTTDNAGNVRSEVRIITVQDVQAPVITLNGSNPMNINVNTAYTEPGATAIDNVDGNITNAGITKTGTVNVSVPGSYTVTYSVTDSSGNTGQTTRTVNVIDNVAPTVAFGMNGNSTWAKTRSTSVTVTDHSSLSTLRYQWTTSTTAPTEASFVTTFTNGANVSSPSSVTGTYYLWILAKDSAGNTQITRSELFRIDNTVPVITLLGSNPTYINAGSSYVEPGVNATDNNGGSVSISQSSNLNVNIPGTYTVTYTGTDTAGNSAVATRTVIVQENIPPVIAFGTNGNATWGQSRSTTVTVTDAHSAVAVRKYLWNTSTTTPSEASFGTDFANGQTITTPAGVSGSYYLWILGKDALGNTQVSRSNVFNLDNTAPVISAVTISKSNPSSSSFRINTSGTPSDGHSGLATTAYEYQRSTDNANWTTVCTTNNTYCDVTGISSYTQYYYRLCVRDLTGNSNCTASGTARIQSYSYGCYQCSTSSTATWNCPPGVSDGGPGCSLVSVSCPPGYGMPVAGLGQPCYENGSGSCGCSSGYEFY